MLRTKIGGYAWNSTRSSCRASSSPSSSASTSSSRPSPWAWRHGWRRSRACGSSPAIRSTGASSTSGSRSSRCRSAWAWYRDRHGVPVRHQLGRARRADRVPIQGPLLGYEAFTAFMLEATFLRRHAVWSRPGPALALLLRLLHGVARNDGLLVLDHRQQFSWMQVPVGHQIVDGKIIPSDWRGDHARAGDDGALAAHAARRVPDDRNVHRGHRGLVRAARRAPRGSAGHDALGDGSGGGADPGAALLRAPHMACTSYSISRRSSPRSRRAGRASSPPRRCGSHGPTRRRGATCSRSRSPKVGSFIATGNWDARGPGLADFPEARIGRRW